MLEALQQTAPVTLSPSFMFVVIALAIVNTSGHPLYIEYFYSHSFIPDALKIDYEVEHHIGIYYNVTAFRPFPGQLLLNLFVRKYNAVRGQPSMDVLKRRNLDFCRTLDRQRNITTDGDDTRPFLLQDTFVTSCPLVNGFYYIKNGTIPNSILPSFVDAGRYIIHFELIQVINELVKLMNLRFILAIKEEDYNQNDADYDYEDEEEEDDEDEEANGEGETEAGGEENGNGEGNGDGEEHGNGEEHGDREEHGNGEEHGDREEHGNGEENGIGEENGNGEEHVDEEINGGEEHGDEKAHGNGEEQTVEKDERDNETEGIRNEEEQGEVEKQRKAETDEKTHRNAEEEENDEAEDHN